MDDRKVLRGAAGHTGSDVGRNCRGRLVFAGHQGRSLPLGPGDQAIELRVARVDVVEKTIELPRCFVKGLSQYILIEEAGQPFQSHHAVERRWPVDPTEWRGGSKIDPLLAYRLYFRPKRVLLNASEKITVPS